MEFFTRVLSGNSRIKERSREAQQVNESFKNHLDGLKNLLQSEESTDVNNLLDTVYESSYPEEQVFMKTPSRARLKSKKELVVRLLIGLEALGVPVMTDLLVYIKTHGMEGMADNLVTLLELLSPLLDGKESPEYTTDDVVDAMDFGWHSSSRKGSPLLNVIASAASSPRASAASAGDSPIPSFLAASPFRRVLSDRSMFLSRAHEMGAKSVLDKTFSAKPTLTSSISSQYPSSNQGLRSDELTYLNIPPITLPPVEEQPTSNSRDGSPKKGLQKKHRRKSSSLRQLFSEEGSEELMSEGSVGALSKRNSMSSSRRRNSSEFAKILLNANEPSSPFLSRGASTEAPEKESLLKAEDEHKEVSRSGKDSSQVSPSPDNVPFWREDARGPFVDFSGDKDNILNPVALTASLMTLNSDAEATTQHVGDAGMEPAPPFNTLFTSINYNLPHKPTLPVGSSTDSMRPASSEVEDDKGLNADLNAHSSSDKDEHLNPEQDSRNELVADADDNGERNASESDKYDRSSNTFHSSLSHEGTLPLQEDMENSAADSNAPTINERTLHLPEDMENVAAYSKAPAIDKSCLPLQDNTENFAANCNVPTINKSTFPLQDNMESSAAYSNALSIHEGTLPLQDNNMVSVAATNDGSTFPLQENLENFAAYSTFDESSLPMQESNTERAATYSHAPTIGASSDPENIENSAAYSNAPILAHESTLPLEENPGKSSASNEAPSTIDESTPPLIEDTSDVLLQVEHKNVLQHGTHQRSRSDSTPARSLLKTESMKEEELNGSQSDRSSSAERLRRRFIERLGSVTSSMESLMMDKGESPDRVVEVVMQDSMPWMQMNECICKKGEDTEVEHEKVSSSESDSESSTTSTSSSSSTEGLDADDQQRHEREPKKESEKDEHSVHEVEKHTLSPDSTEEGDKEDVRSDLVNTYTHEGNAERAPGLQAGHHLQGESKVDAQQEDDHSHVGFGLFQRIFAPLLIPSSSIEPAVDEYAFDGLHERESEKGIESVRNEDESASSNPSEGESTGSKVESTNDSRYSMENAHFHSADHSQTPPEAAKARVVQVNFPLSGSSTDVSVLHNTPLPEDKGDSINIHIIEHDSNSASNGDWISEANSSEPFDDNHQNDKVDLYLNIPNLDGLRTNSESSTLGKVNTLGRHQALDRELSPSISNLQENERDLHQTPDHDASTALSSLEGNEKVWSEDEGSQHHEHEDLEMREQGDANDLRLSSSKGDEKVFTGDEGSESQRRDAMEIREQDDEDNECDYHTLGTDRVLESTTLPTEPLVLREDDNSVNLLPRDAVTLTVPQKAHQQPLCGSPVELEEHLKYNGSQFEQLLSELDTTEEDVPLHALSAKSDMEAVKTDMHGSEKIFEDGVVIGPDFKKMPPEVEDSKLNNETIPQSDVGDLSLGQGTMQSDGGDFGFGKETMEPNVESSRLGKQSMQSDDTRHLGLDIKETLPWDANLERDFVDNEGQFIVGGPGPIADLDECKLQADPETSYQPNYNPQSESSSPKVGLHVSRVVYEANTDNNGMHAHSPDSQVMVSSDDIEKPMECEEVHVNSDGKKQELKYPLLVEGVLQEEILSKPVCWEASEVVDAGSTHPLQVDEGNVQTSSVVPGLAVYAAQMQEGVGANPQKSVSHVFEEASHDAHQPPLTARTLDDSGPLHGHPTYVSAADSHKSVSHVCEEASHDAHQLPLTARTLDDYGPSPNGHPTHVSAADSHKNVNHVREEASHDAHQLPLTARTLDDYGPLHGNPTYVSAANHFEPEHVLNQPAAAPHDPHMDRWDIESTAAKGKRKHSYAAKLVRGCLSCCREPHSNT